MTQTISHQERIRRVMIDGMLTGDDIELDGRLCQAMSRVADRLLADARRIGVSEHEIASVVDYDGVVQLEQRVGW